MKVEAVYPLHELIGDKQLIIPDISSPESAVPHEIPKSDQKSSVQKERQLPPEFTANHPLHLQFATESSVSEYGEFVDGETPIEDHKTSHAGWPFKGKLITRMHSGVLHQEFKMKWVPSEVGNEIHFTGIAGSFKGVKGKPGVFWDGTKYAVETLMSRPDGSFLVRPLEKRSYIMFLAKADPETGKRTLEKSVGNKLEDKPSRGTETCASSITTNLILCPAISSFIV
ncbi:hypothetical protein AB6A40_010173 [Gnathostoma spinigerum]|uniref:SH2 domain-containing protein n=1 Tax=Gnathostoma spinigerum TaxID=75299 RepID=A0ABD6F111_9BILA